MKKFVLLIFLVLLQSCIQTDKTEDEFSDDIERYHSFKGSLKQYHYSTDSVHSFISSIRVDTLKSDIISDYSYYLLLKKDSVGFRYWNNKGLELATEFKDTSKVAEAYWDLANFYNREKRIDSAFLYYNRAYNLYEIIGEDFLAARMLINVATIQKDIKDFAASEVSAVNAIQKIKSLNKGKQMYMAYNLLGVVSNGLGEYDRAVGYHMRALEIAGEMKDTGNIAITLNNLGVVHKNHGRYTEAFQNFNEALLIDSLYYEDPQLYAMLLDNLAHNKLLSNDTLDIEPLFFRALKIRDSIDHKAGIVVNKIHLGEYYLFQKDTSEAINYFTEAKELASEKNYFRDLLNSTLFLSKIDRENSERLLLEYINTSDSLLLRERAVRNKFTRIRFETDEFIAENEQLTQQKKWLIGGSTSALVLSFMGIIMYRQKARNRRLKNERDQQKANEDIYKLLLDQENKIEEGKSKEKVRISKELHDGVLSRMFGIRFTLSHLNDRYDEPSIEAKQKHLDDLRQIEEEIRLISHDLQKNYFEEVGFLKLLGHLLDDQARILGFGPSLESDKHIPWEKISNPVKMNLYRIVQEALQNINRYAGANEATISFKNAGNNLKVCITDNGSGFDVEKKIQGIGLKNMKSRVKEIGGSFEISSSKLGTVITIEIPLNHGW